MLDIKKSVRAGISYAGNVASTAGVQTPAILNISDHTEPFISNPHKTHPGPETKKNENTTLVSISIHHIIIHPSNI
jgi:hypothetical protein